MKRVITRASIILLAINAIMAGSFIFTAATSVSAQNSSGRGWRVWIRTDPCSGRRDWLSVAKEHEGGGKNFYVTYETILGSDGRCTRSDAGGCTFAEANQLMEELRSNEAFFDYCCRDYSVWENTQTDEKSVFLIRTGTPGVDWRFVQGDLCCEEAEELAGKPGACSGTTGGGKGKAAGHGYSGIWTARNEFGTITMDLTQSGSRVSGTMSNAWGSGSFDGTLTGGSVRFTWDLLGERGSGEVKLSSDGKSFSGTWSVNSTGRSYPVTGTKDR